MWRGGVGGCLRRRQKQAGYQGGRWRCRERCQAQHTQMFLDVWTKTDEQRQCAEARYSIPNSDHPSETSGKGAETAEKEREDHTAETETQRKSWTLQKQGLGGAARPSAEARGWGESITEGKMKVAPCLFSALLALSEVLTEGPHSLGEKGETKG